MSVSEQFFVVMCVVVQRMIVPAVAGTAFSVEISSSYPAMHVCASYGLGEAVVSGIAANSVSLITQYCLGTTTGDEWLLDKADPSLRIIKQVCGSKAIEFVPKPGGGPGIIEREVDLKRRQVIFYLLHTRSFIILFINKHELDLPFAEALLRCRRCAKSG